MALAGRSTRRRGSGARWIAVGLVATILILLIDASLHSTSTKTTEALSAGVWVDRLLPIIEASNQQGQVISNVWTGGLKMSASSIDSQLAEASTGSAQAYQEAVHLKPPPELEGPAGLLAACLLSRSEAAQSLQKSMKAFLAESTPTVSQTPQPSSTTTSTTTSDAASGASTTTTTTVPPPNVVPLVAATASSIGAVGSDMQVGDQAYHLFRSSMTTPMPSSMWLANSAPYGAQSADIFLTSLQSSIASTQVNQVKIYAVSLNPAPVAKQANGVELLPRSSELFVTLVVADTGNQPATGLTITASISTADAGGATSAVDFTGLQPGQAHTVQDLGPLTPADGVPVTLNVKVAGPAGSSIPIVQHTVVFEMPAPPPPPTTTTSTSSTTPTTSTSG